MENTTYEKHVIGKDAETRAAEWFAKTYGARVIEKNYLCKCGELDLVLQIETPVERSRPRIELVIVEVRARLADRNWVNGVESVDGLKRHKIARTIRHYLMNYRGPATSVRFDILAWDGQGWTHVPNVWLE